MAQRKPNASKRDPAALYRAKLESKEAAIVTQTARWSPSFQDRLDLTWARLLYMATAPSTPASGLRKWWLETRLFRAATRAPAQRRGLHRAARTVLRAAAARDPTTFKRSRDELLKLWREAKAQRHPDRPGRR